MRISIVNPNATMAMTRSVEAAARRVAGVGTEIVASGNPDGPPSIEGHFDGAMAVPGLLRALLAAEREGAQAHIIACFDDTGLDAARSLLVRPVVGIGEAAAKIASCIAHRFTVVTTLACSVPILEDNLRRYGLSDRARVRASDIPVLALEADPAAASRRISQEIEAAIAEDRAEAIVLGCAGMADLARDLSARHAIPVVEGVAAAVRLAEGLAALGLATAKRGSYAFPPVKSNHGPAQTGPAAGVPS